jgi:hypothetical protein
MWHRKIARYGVAVEKKNMRYGIVQEERAGYWYAVAGKEKQNAEQKKYYGRKQN